MRSAFKKAGLLLALACAAAPTAQADWVVHRHITGSVLDNTARCLAAPKTSTQRLVVRRIRMTRSGSTSVSHQFYSKVSEDVVGLTYDLSACVLPGCRALYTAEGVREGQVYDADGLNLVLPPGARLYYYGDTFPASTAVTIEVFYDEIQ